MDGALEALRRLGWKVELNARAAPLPKTLTDRFPNLPPPLAAFLSALKTCEREDERVWFLSARSFAARGKEEAFPWDAFERDEAEGEYEDRPGESRAFWDAHLPILQSLEGPYAMLAVVVDKASPAYGAVIYSDADDFHYANQVAPSFEALLAMIAKAAPQGCDPALEHLLLHPDSEPRLRSAPLGPFGWLKQKLSSFAPFESYRVGVVVEHPITRPLDADEAWARIMRPLSVLIGKLPSKAEIRRDPEFGVVEIWAPRRKAAFDANRGPEMFCRFDRDEIGDTQGLVLAIRKDVLRQVDIAADDVVFVVRELMGEHKVINFDRTWGEFGRFGGLVINGLDATSSDAVLDWVSKHPKAKRMSFRARHNRPR
jgi:hypothetical protein